MDTLTERLEALKTIEDLLGFFAVRYDGRVVHAHGRQIIARFHLHLRANGPLAALTEVDKYRSYRDLLTRAYREFVASVPLRTAAPRDDVLRGVVEAA